MNDESKPVMVRTRGGFHVPNPERWTPAQIDAAERLFGSLMGRDAYDVRQKMVHIVSLEPVVSNIPQTDLK